MTAQLTQTEAAQHLERAWNEAERLKDRFSLRSIQEKKRLGVLQKVMPALKRLANGGEGTVNKAELAVLDSLKPAKASAP